MADGHGGWWRVAVVWLGVLMSRGSVGQDSVVSSLGALRASLEALGHASLDEDVKLNETVRVVSKEVSIFGRGGEARALDGAHAVQLFWVGAGGRLRIEDATLVRGQTAGNGGAVGVEGGSVVIQRSWLLNNRAARGAAVALLRGSSMTATDCVFADNVATLRGGGVYVAERGGLVLRGGVFRRNEALRGGAVYLYEESGLGASHTTFDRNKAGDRGGAIVVDRRSDANATDCDFPQNGALEGQSLYVIDFSTVTTSNCSGLEAYVAGADFRACTADRAGAEPACSTADENQEIHGRSLVVPYGSVSITTMAP